MKLPTALLPAALLSLAACAPLCPPGKHIAIRPAALDAEAISFGMTAPFGGATHVSELVERLRGAA